LSGRTAFVVTAGSALFVLLFLLVARPAVERGGWGELGLVVVMALAVLLFERWLRTR
jgi:hypothetical protein